MPNMWANLTLEQRQARVKKIVDTRQRNIAANKAEWEQRRQEALDLATGAVQARRELDEAKAALAALRPAHELSIRSKQLSGRYMLTEEQIVAQAMPWEQHTGVYFLIKNHRVVYVGQSVNVHARIAAHTDKSFDSVALLFCSRDVLDKIESLYIHCLRPPLNGVRPDKCLHAPIDLKNLIGVSCA